MITVHINKPVYDTYVYVRAKYIKQALENGEELKISCPTAERICSPNEWLHEGAPNKIKKVFRYVDKPMTLYGNYIEIPKTDKKVAHGQISLV